MQFTAYRKNLLTLTFPSPFGDIECNGAYARLTDPLGVAHDTDHDAFSDLYRLDEVLPAFIGAVCDHYKLPRPARVEIGHVRYLRLEWENGHRKITAEYDDDVGAAGFALEYREDEHAAGIAHDEIAARSFRNLLHNVRRCMEVTR
jgi:hypothetical protein